MNLQYATRIFKVLLPILLIFFQNSGFSSLFIEVILQSGEIGNFIFRWISSRHCCLFSLVLLGLIKNQHHIKATVTRYCCGRLLCTKSCSCVPLTIFIDFTIGGKLGKLSLGGHGESPLNLPRVAAGVENSRNDSISTRFFLRQIAQITNQPVNGRENSVKDWTHP